MTGKLHCWVSVTIYKEGRVSKHVFRKLRIEGLTALNPHLRNNSHRLRVCVVAVPDLLHNCTCN
jgi:hypothetical protein